MSWLSERLAGWGLSKETQRKITGEFSDEEPSGWTIPTPALPATPGSSPSVPGGVTIGDVITDTLRRAGRDLLDFGADRLAPDDRRETSGVSAPWLLIAVVVGAVVLLVVLLRRRG